MNHFYDLAILSCRRDHLGLASSRQLGITNHRGRVHALMGQTRACIHPKLVQLEAPRERNM